MPMCANGLAKLIEECGELQQIAGKKLAYFHTDRHPDGAGAMSIRLQAEMGDVMAAIWFAAEALGLDSVDIENRKSQKLALFRKWHATSGNNHEAVDRNFDEVSGGIYDPSPTL